MFSVSSTVRSKRKAKCSAVSGSPQWLPYAVECNGRSPGPRTRRRRIPHASTPIGALLFTCPLDACIQITWVFQSQRTISKSQNSLFSVLTTQYANSRPRHRMYYVTYACRRHSSPIINMATNPWFRNSKESRAQWNPSEASGGPATPHRYPSSGQRRMATGRPRSSLQHQGRPPSSQLEQHMQTAPTSRWRRKAGGDSLATT